VEGRADEALAPRDVGQKRLVEKAGGADEDIGDIGAAFGGLDLPAAIGEASRDDLLIEADEFGKAAVARDLLDIGPDLGGGRVFVRPIVVRLERKLVLARQTSTKSPGKALSRQVPPTSPAFS
jgi:hypothetical protein